MVENISRAKLDNNTYSGGDSTIVLLIPRTTPTANDNTFISQRREIFRQLIPGMDT